MSESEQPLVLSQRRLREAIHALAEPIPVWDGGVCRWSDAVYWRLRGSLRGQPTRSGRRVPDSRLPCRADVLTLLIAIDMTAAEWEPNGKGTVERLRQVAAQDRRPQDCELLDGISATVEAWTLKAVELLGDKSPEVALRLPCPSCGSRFVYRNHNGENVRSWALRVSEDGARCLAPKCEATWPSDQLEWLARLLGCPALPA